MRRANGRVKNGTLRGRISTNPKICGGRPCIRGHRIPVEVVLDFLASGVAPEELCGPRYFPTITRKDVLACLAYAAQRVHREVVLRTEGPSAARR